MNNLEELKSSFKRISMMLPMVTLNALVVDYLKREFSTDKLMGWDGINPDGTNVYHGIKIRERGYSYDGDCLELYLNKYNYRSNSRAYKYMEKLEEALKEAAVLCNIKCAKKFSEKLIADFIGCDEKEVTIYSSSVLMIEVPLMAILSI